MNELVFFINNVLIAGLVIGSIYALGAIGVTLLFGILRFAHFAHGELMTLGAFFSLATVAVFTSLGFSSPLPLGAFAIPVSMAITAMAAVGIDRICYRPLRLRGARPVTLVMASIGVALMLQGLIRLFAGPSVRTFYFAEQKSIYRIELPFELARRTITLTGPQIFLILFTIGAVITLHLILTRTRTGKAMRAMSDNSDLARVTGIDTNKIVMITWIIGGGLAAAAGTLLALDVSLQPALAFNLLLAIFAAVIVGGIGQPYGAIAGGFVVGFAETLAVFNWALLVRPFRDSFPDWIDLPNRISFVPTEYKLAVPFFILVVVLIWRPTGIFKGRVL